MAATHRRSRWSCPRPGNSGSRSNTSETSGSDSVPTLPKVGHVWVTRWLSATLGFEFALDQALADRLDNGTDNAEADGPIPSSLTKSLVKGDFWGRVSLST